MKIGAVRSPELLIATAYKNLILLSGIFLPMGAITYLYFFVNPDMKFHSATSHEVAIGFAIAILVLIAFIGYRAYSLKGELHLRLLTLAFLGNALVYAPHGILTPIADHNPILFLVFGPLSRFVMSVYFLAAVLSFKRSSYQARSPRWWPHILLFAGLDIAVSALVISVPAAIRLRVIEFTALSFYSSAILLVLVLRPRTRLIRFYVSAPVLFAQASFAFLLARPWNHMWWLAHGIFAAGAFVLGYAVICAYEVGT
jgi:hypothetical protein